jgi:PncC family amidohydrolase
MIKQEIQTAKLVAEYQNKTGKSLTIATSESATGGKIAAKLISVPGSSAYFKGALVAYSNEIKINVLGVKKATIEKYGAVSQETAIEMAQGARILLNVDICISDTGIAGPTGSSINKPIGLFFIGLSSSCKNLCKKIILSGSREENRESATEKALELLNQYLTQYIQSYSGTNIDKTNSCFDQILRGF